MFSTLGAYNPGFRRPRSSSLKRSRTNCGTRTRPTFKLKLCRERVREKDAECIFVMRFEAFAGLGRGGMSPGHARSVKRARRYPGRAPKEKGEEGKRKCRNEIELNAGGPCDKEQAAVIGASFSAALGHVPALYWSGNERARHERRLAELFRRQLRSMIPGAYFIPRRKIIIANEWTSRVCARCRWNQTKKKVSCVRTKTTRSYREPVGSRIGTRVLS